MGEMVPVSSFGELPGSQRDRGRRQRRCRMQVSKTSVDMMAQPTNQFMVRVVSTLHRAPVGQGPSGPDWLAIFFGFWSGRALATGTAWAGLCLIHHHYGSCGLRR